MASRIEDYALIGDSYSAALVARDGSIDWLCLPRFDSGAVFAALLGSREHGRWLLAPRGAVRAVRRRYREGTLILETDFETADGAVRVGEQGDAGGNYKTPVEWPVLFLCHSNSEKPPYACQT